MHIKTYLVVCNFSELSGEIMYMDGIYSYEFQNLIYSLIHIMDEKEQSYKTALVKIEKTIELIDKELRNK